jgi:hypothetical protein
MNENKNTQIAIGSPLARHEIIGIIQQAIGIKAYRFSRKLAEHWLNEFPGDLQIELMLTQAMLQENRADLGIPILKRITFTDPEYLPAHRLLAFASTQMPFSTQATAQACILALGGKGISQEEDIPEWGNNLLEARKALKKSDYQDAEEQIHQALLKEPNTPLPAVLHLHLAIQNFEWLSVRNLAEQYLERWPDCLIFNLVLADVLMKGGQEDQAVSLLHHSATLDIGGQVPTRLWGTDFPYRALWPENPQVSLPFPIPANVAGVLGWNQLPQGRTTHASKEDFEARRINKGDREGHLPRKEKEKLHHVNSSIQAELKGIAERLNIPHFNNADGRFPVYVLLTSREGLENQYGTNNLAEIHSALERIVKATRAMSHWDAILIYVDDGENTDKVGLPPAIAKDPWSIKTFIHDLDNVLAHRGEMIGALLIVGGANVIPFHRLPNPIDDFDHDVPSDNPYANCDENYFIPSWPIGRLPGSAGDDPQPLIDQLNNIYRHRLNLRNRRPFLRRLFDSLFSRLFSKNRSRPSFGYTAEIWRRAANSVFRPIGKPHSLVISPPTEAEQISKKHSIPANLAYFNLHGLEDSAEWYGQRDPIETPEGPDYPIALRPQDIVNSGRAPQIVFSEACYGGHIIEKNVEDAIVLKFLSSGTLAVVGSTCTSYGSISTPLIAADLLGKAFWNYLQDGYTAGEALRRAKIHLIREMQKRQGYLDGEDQKTLLSFVLYGDPLAQSYNPRQLAKSLLRYADVTGEVNTVCDKSNGNQTQKPEIPDEIITQVKSVVREYLPGLKGAKVEISHEHGECQGHNCPTHQLGAKSTSRFHTERKVVTLSKQITLGKQIHPHYARLTFNEKGKMVKLAISR